MDLNVVVEEPNENVNGIGDENVVPGRREQIVDGPGEIQALEEAFAARLKPKYDTHAYNQPSPANHSSLPKRHRVFRRVLPRGLTRHYCFVLSKW